MNEEKSIVVPAPEIKHGEQYTVNGITVSKEGELVIDTSKFPKKTMTV